MEWTFKKHLVNNNNTDDTELEWILKKYRVNNDTTDDTDFDDYAPVLQLIIQAVSVMSLLLFWSIYLAVGIMLDMEIRSACQVVVRDNNCGNNIVLQK